MKTYFFFKTRLHTAIIITLNCWAYNTYNTYVSTSTVGWQSNSTSLNSSYSHTLVRRSGGYMELCAERVHLFSVCSWVTIKVKEMWRITGIPSRPFLVMVHVWQKLLMLPTTYRIKSTLVLGLSRVSHDLIQTYFLVRSSYYNKVHTILTLLD